MKKDETRFELYKVNPKNEILITSYGTMARICQTAIDDLEERGISVGLFRPVTLFPFPEQQLFKEATRKNIRAVLTIEMSMAQMHEDVQRIIMGKTPTAFFGRTGGVVPSPEEVIDQVMGLLDKHAGKKSSKRPSSQGKKT